MGQVGASTSPSATARRAIVRSLVGLCDEMGIEVVAEGIETLAERDCLYDLGINLMQGYFFAKPAFRSVAAVDPSVFAFPRS